MNMTSWELHSPGHNTIANTRKDTTLYGFVVSVVWGPDTSDTLVDTCDGLLGALQLLAAGLLQQIRLLEDLLGLEVADTNCLFSSVDVVTLDDGMLVRPWRYADFNLRIGFGEGRKLVFQESNHPARATRPVAVVKVQTLALQNEGAHAVSSRGDCSDSLYRHCR